MALDLSGYSRAFAFMYSDLCDVYRYHNVLDATGATRKERDADATYTDVCCLASPEQSDDASPRSVSHIPLEQYISVHVEPSVRLIAGDYLVVRKIGSGRVMRRYYGTIGEPKVYPTHIKATLKVDKAEG